MTFSAEKVENVVKPPQNPVINKNLSAESCFRIDAENRPIKKQPTILMTKVAIGKPEVFKNFKEKKEMR